MRVVQPVLDRGEWWSCPTPSPGSLQKKEIQNSRKDPFFYQIPACNLAPSEKGRREGEKKGHSKVKPIRSRKTEMQILVLAFERNLENQ